MSWRRALHVAAVLGVSACSGDGNPSTTQTGGSDSTTAATTTAGSSSSGASSSGPSSGGGSGSGGSTGQPTASYSAIALAGDPNVVRIHKADEDTGQCAWVVISTSPIGLLAISTPAGWVAEDAFINDDPSSCDSDDPATSGSIQATAATGTITFATMGDTFPCTLDLDMLVTYDTLGVEQSFVASGVPVDGC